jgi:hypothetical protein
MTQIPVGNKIPDDWVDLYKSMTSGSAPLNLLDAHDISIQRKTEIFETVKNTIEKLKRVVPMFN